jgi:outer membrane protein OmpA-like peptidoglycan-associated protein/tetratricopeptide (TPR) repeat protein
MRILSPRNSLFVALVVVISACTNAHIKSGDKYFENLSYSKAIPKYEKVLKKQPENNEVELKLANSYRQLNNSVEAEKHYRAVKERGGLEGEDHLTFVQMLMRNKKYDEAKAVVQEYLNDHPNDPRALSLLGSTKAVDQLKEDSMAYILTEVPLDFLVSAFGAAHYGRGIAFAAETEITSAATANPWTGHSFLDLYYMEKDKNGNWDTPKIFAEELNGRFHDGPLVFNAAQDMVIYTRSAMRNQRKQLVNEKRENQFYLYQSSLKDGKWSEPEEMPFNNPKYSVGHPALSADGKTLYFSSDMPGGFGGSDIYKSTYDGTKWSEPVNLGNVINTPGNEVFPYVAKDGKLYFSSEGHQNLGGLDVFVSEYQGGNWYKPVNLAYPLNSSRDDFAIVFNDNDSTGYVSSDRSGVDMIYEFRRVPPIFVLEGIAKLKADQLPIDGVVITIINLSDGDTARVTTGKDGKFKFNLLPEKQYKVMGEKEGYFTLSEEFKTGKKGGDKKVNFNFEIDEIVASQSGTGSGKPGDGRDTAAKTYNIGDVFYDFNDAAIRPDARPVLDKLVTLLKDNPKISIEIHSHCDSRGTDAYNMALSNRRAQSVVNYLVERGISRSRLKSKGFGRSQPVNRCTPGVECSEQEHQQNRRTEFIVLDTKSS